MSTEDQKAREAFEAWRKSVEWWDFNHDGRATNRKSSVHMAWEAWQEATRLALMSNAAPEIDMSGQRVDAARRNALEQAAKVVEDMRDLKEAARAQKAADEAISRDDKGDMLHRLRHCSTVSLFNGALERAAKAIRALADPLQGKETPR